jgi:hypothetical protein
MPPKRKTLPSIDAPTPKKQSKSNDRTTQLIADFGDLKSLNYTPKSPLTHLEFRTALYTTLLGSSLNVKIP